MVVKVSEDRGEQGVRGGTGEMVSFWAEIYIGVRWTSGCEGGALQVAIVHDRRGLAS
jgi:hypothetical protein